VDAVVKTIKISGKEFNYADGTAEVRMLLLLLPAVAHILPAQWLQLDRQERKQATWAKHLTAAVDRYGCPKLKCRCCDQLLSAANPSDTHLKHVDKETGQCKTAQKLLVAPPAPEATGAHLCAGHRSAAVTHCSSAHTLCYPGPNSTGSKQMTMDAFIPSTQQATAALKELAMFFYTGQASSRGPRQPLLSTDVHDSLLSFPRFPLTSLRMSTCKSVSGCFGSSYHP
jgi:hypothetical protein